MLPGSLGLPAKQWNFEKECRQLSLAALLAEKNDTIQIEMRGGILGQVHCCSSAGRSLYLGEAVHAIASVLRVNHLDLLHGDKVIVLRPDQGYNDADEGSQDQGDHISYKCRERLSAAGGSQTRIFL